jgi:hypothetical protein
VGEVVALGIVKTVESLATWVAAESTVIEVVLDVRTSVLLAVDAGVAAFPLAVISVSLTNWVDEPGVDLLFGDARVDVGCVDSSGIERRLLSAGRSAAHHEVGVVEILVGAGCCLKKNVTLTTVWVGGLLEQSWHWCAVLVDRR